MKIVRSENKVTFDAEGGTLFINKDKPFLSNEDDGMASELPEVTFTNFTFYGVSSNKWKRILDI